MERYLDCSLSPVDRAKDLLKKLSLEEKVKQLSCVSVMPAPLDTLNLKGGIGNAVIGMQKNERLIGDVKEVQDYIMANSPHHIPALFHAEGLTGPVCLFGGNQYPAPIGLAATFSPELVREMSGYTSRQLAANGIRLALSPVADLSRDLRWGRCNETYGGDSTLAAAFTVSFVQGMQGDDLTKGVAATLKHFLGYSASEGALNAHMALLPRNILREQYAKPFEAAINLADVKCVMNSYSVIDGRPVTANKAILTDLLRGELGFNGATVADYGSVTQIKTVYNLSEDNAGAAALALEAGMDVEFPEQVIYSNELIAAVKAGKIDEKLIDRSVLRLLMLKFELGLFENPYGVGDYDRAMDRTKPDGGSLIAARKSITLLKNDGILPIKDRKIKLAVIGPTGNSLRLMYGHYMATATKEMVAAIIKSMTEKKNIDTTNILNQGREAEEGAETNMAPQPKSIEDKYFFDGEIKKAYPNAKTIFAALNERFKNITFAEGCDYKGCDESQIESAVKLAAQSDIVILTVGEKNGIDASCTSGEGVDTVNLSLAGMQEKLIREVYAVNRNCVIVHTGCRPLCSEWVYENIPAVVEAWLPATFGGEAIAGAICGEYNPAGRTPVDLPRSAAHTPVYHSQLCGSSSDDRLGMDKTGYMCSPSTSLIPFGYGLSYTKFDYSDLKLSKGDNGDINITVTVKNTGDEDGEEVVQLYGKDMCASMVRPRQELVGFKRVNIKRGESKTVRFCFNIDFFAFENYNKEWVAEAGEFSFFVGGHSKDKRLTCVCFLEKDIKVNPNQRTFFAEAE